MNVLKPPVSLLLACLARDFRRLPKRLSMHFYEEYARENRHRALLEDPKYKGQAESIRQLLRYGIESSRKEVEAKLRDVLTYKPGKPPLGLRIERLYREARKANQSPHTTFTTGRLSNIKWAAGLGLARTRGGPIQICQLYGEEAGAHHSKSDAYYHAESYSGLPSFRGYLYWLVETVLGNGEISKLRVCPQCQSGIFEKIKRKRFCSTTCKNAFNNHRNRKTFAGRYKNVRDQQFENAKTRFETKLKDRKRTTKKNATSISALIDETEKEILTGKLAPTGARKKFKAYVEKIREGEMAKLP